MFERAVKESSVDADFHVQCSRSLEPAVLASSSSGSKTHTVLFILEGKGRFGQRRWVRLRQTVFHAQRFPAELKVLAASWKRAVIVLLANSSPTAADILSMLTAERL